MCDYEDMRDTETQSTAGRRRERGSEGRREGRREGGSHIYLYTEIFKGNNVSVIAISDILPESVT